MSPKLGFSLLAMLLCSGAALAADLPGVTATEIKIGGVYPLSGPASSLGGVGKGTSAYIQSINDRGGINGRRIQYMVMDDAYSPPKTVEQVRKLVESDDVAFIFGQLGTPGASATAKYLKSKGVPSIGVMSGSAKFTDADEYPLTTTSIVSYDTEGKIYAKYLMREMPGAKYAILYQNDDLGKDYVNAFRSVLKERFDNQVVAMPYEVTQPTVESHVVSLKASGAGALVVAGTPKFAAQAIRKAAEIGWKPIVIINSPSGSVATTLQPAGLENSIGVIVGATTKDPTDPRWAQDEGVKQYHAFFEKYLPGADIANTVYLAGYHQGKILEQILKQCGDDLSRQNIVKQAKHISQLELSTAIPGIRINTSDKSNMFWSQMRLQRWTGTTWEPFGEVLDSYSE